MFEERQQIVRILLVPISLLGRNNHPGGLGFAESLRSAKSLRSVESLLSDGPETGLLHSDISSETEGKDRQQYILNLLGRVALFAK